MIDIIWITLCAILVAMMQPGFMCLESGLTRSKNSINVAIKNLADFGLSIVLFWFLGYALMFGESWQGWIGTTHFLFTPNPFDPREGAFFLFQAMFCGAAITIISGAVAERMRFISYLIITVLVSGLIYPIFGHWAWKTTAAGEPVGWLIQLGFIDFAGSTVVHSVGGWVALAAVIVIGPREGRFPPNLPPQEIHGHHIPLAILGTLLLWVGWFGFNGGSTFALDGRVGWILLNTLLAGSIGMLSALSVDWFLQRQARIKALINGCLAGLVAITASCHIVSPLSAIIIGGTGGIIMILATYLLEYLKIDDAVGAIPVHTAAGIWGTLAVALFMPIDASEQSMAWTQQFLVQLQGVVTCSVWSFGLAYLLLKMINVFFPMRISPEQERIGLNVSEHGASTELLDLLQAMEQQALTGDMEKRVHEEPFTEIGQIAAQYNRVLERLHTETEKAKYMAKVAHGAQHEAERVNTQLTCKLKELREFNRIATGRELRMIELKHEINLLAIQIGQQPPYDLSFDKTH